MGLQRFDLLQMFQCYWRKRLCLWFRVSDFGFRIYFSAIRENASLHAKRDKCDEIVRV